MKTPDLKPIPTPDWLNQWLRRPWIDVGMGLAILALDYLTGPFLLFPILFVIPVALSAWYYRPRMAYLLAVVLPVGRLLVAEFVDRPHPFAYVVANALIRMAVLLLLAYLVARTARQTGELQERITGLVTMCAWSRTIEYKGEWVSFEQYLKRRFNIDTSHGISPAEASKMSQGLKRKDKPPKT